MQVRKVAQGATPEYAAIAVSFYGATGAPPGARATHIVIAVKCGWNST